MKLKNIIPQHYRRQVIQQFGDAQLCRLPNGQHELIGGTPADQTAACEWVSLFAHEIVFTNYRRPTGVPGRSRPPFAPARLQPAG
jgi:hypothetical protein